MKNFRISVAQIHSVSGDVEENIRRHILAIKKAATLGVSYLVFPELSLTGYEPTLANQLAFTKNDDRLNPLIACAMEHAINIAVGAPLASAGLPNIALIIISQSGRVDTYQKMHLHLGEDVYFSPGEHHHILSLCGTKIANAICADTSQASHAQIAFGLGASVYVAGVLITEAGYQTDTDLMKSYALKHNMLVAMANHNKSTGGWQPIGKSAMWSNRGLLVSATENQQALIIAELIDEQWCARLHEI